MSLTPCQPHAPSDILMSMSNVSGHTSDTSDPAGAVTLLIQAAANGEPRAAEQLFPLIYNELRALAQNQMARERSDHTLQATALVHEAYMKLVKNVDINWTGRGHFYIAAAGAMRRILVDHARTRGAIKRGGDWNNVSLNLNDLAEGRGLDELLGIDEELTRLAAEDPQAAQVVHLRFFVGLSVNDTAKALDIAPRSVDRQWQYAKAWLKSRLTADQPPHRTQERPHA